MNLVRQRAKGECLPACLAMIANTTIDDVLATTRMLEGKGGCPYLPDNEAVKWLASRMIWYGLRIGPARGLTAETESFRVDISLDIPAILSVPSENFPGLNHAVVWDNERRKILDPQKDEPQDLSSYPVIHEWVPVTYL